MCLEKEIGRLADVLEKIEAKMGGENVVSRTAPVAQVKPAAKVKKKTGAKKGDLGEPVGTAVGMGEPVKPLAPTPEDFLKFCNTTLLGITDTVDRAAKIAVIKEMLKKDYNAASIKAVPVESIAECKTKFDMIIAGV